ncbi:MAG: ATP-binding cassette domain-containing protein, partial [Dehalococcoidales bacterium]|nr:ATP-binding cassette domain-containing protein [Dehalococcoidales bacterium]
MNIIVCQGLSKKYGKILALDNLDLEIKEGTLFGFLGPNGAGKTTLMRILYGEESADEGVILLRGRP